jgi:hypothetical protein
MIMKSRSVALSFVLVAALAASTTMVFAADMFSGTWKMNVAKSKINSQPAPKSFTRTNTPVDGGLKSVTNGVNADGKKIHSETTVKFDGKDYPVVATLDGKPDATGADMVSAKKVDDYTLEVTGKKMGMVLGVTKVVVSKDGKTITATTTGKDSKGVTVTDTVIDEKQ